MLIINLDQISGMNPTYKKTSFLSSRPVAFLIAFFSVFIVTLGVLSSFGIIPVPRAQDLSGPLSEDSASSSSTVVHIAEYPVKIHAPDIGLNQIITTPKNTDAKVLDEALLKSAVHYPGSGLLGEEGNVLLFGHSSYLPTVFNPAYKAFNGIQNLKTGQTLTISSGTTSYTYRVTSVRFAKATDDDVIDLSKVGKKLTLVTCNSFKTKSDRFVVEAEFVESRPL